VKAARGIAKECDNAAKAVVISTVKRGGPVAVAISTERRGVNAARQPRRQAVTLRGIARKADRGAALTVNHGVAKVVKALAATALKAEAAKVNANRAEPARPSRDSAAARPVPVLADSGK